MIYSSHDQKDQAEARGHARSADRMATFILVLMIVWVFGAALMFTAAYKGSKMTAVDAERSQSSAPAAVAPAEAP